ncbi:MAG: DUF489 family protein [Acinetobacter sp.]|nr:DUF489 family protein [Acinetobacter sp.]
MSHSPFHQLPPLSERQQRTLALAAVYQAAQLAHLLAYGESMTQGDGQRPPYFISNLQACLNIQPQDIQNKNPLLYFQQLSHLTLGLQSLENSLTLPFSTSPKSRLPQVNPNKLITTYAVALLQLEKKVYKNADFVQRIRTMQQQVLKQLSFFNYDYLHPSIIAAIAQCYSETASTLQPRILIKGKADILKDVQHANRIRAALMTGLQAAHLWRQLGGSSWNFIFGKTKLLTDLRDLVRLHYQHASQTSPFTHSKD